MRSATVLSALILGVAGTARAAVSTGVDPDAKLPYWQYEDELISLRLVQRLPDQTRGFFAARGFNKPHSDVIARACVFQSSFKNRAEPGSKVLISYDLTRWRVRTGGRSTGLIVREDWAKRWRAMKADQRPSKPARIALEWSLLPTRQQYRRGDYNWGMTAYGLAPGAKFDLTLYWQADGKARSAVLPGVVCAPDVSVEPGQ